MNHTKGIKVSKVIADEWTAVYEDISVTGKTLEDAIKKYDEARKAKGREVIRK